MSNQRIALTLYASLGGLCETDRNQSCLNRAD